MKIFKFILQFILSISMVSILSFWITGIPSAFEADRLCHSILASYPTESEIYGCDHDIETHQWILFENQKDSNPALVLKRFRYRFL